MNLTDYAPYAEAAAAIRGRALLSPAVAAVESAAIEQFSAGVCYLYAATHGFLPECSMRIGTAAAFAAALRSVADHIENPTVADRIELPASEP